MLLLRPFHHLPVLTSNYQQQKLIPIGILVLTPSNSVEKRMEEEMGSEEANLPSKPSRRRRASQGHAVINVAGARSEIAYALQLHTSPPPPPCVTEKEPNIEGNLGNSSSNYEINVSMFSDAQYCYSLSEAMPLPGPTWSTTAPSVLAEPPSASLEASVGLEWGENQASSYTWWLGFLEGLDGNVTAEKLDHPLVENVVSENSKVLSHESPFVDAIDLSCCPDDWLMTPSMEKDGGDMVMT